MTCLIYIFIIKKVHSIGLNEQELKLLLDYFQFYGVTFSFLLLFTHIKLERKIVLWLSS